MNYREELEKRRDELALEWIGQDFEPDSVLQYDKYAIWSASRDSFNVLLEQTVRLAEALEESRGVECIGRHIVFKCRCSRCRTLADFKEFLGGSDE